MHTGITPCEDWSDGATSQGTPSQKLGERPGTDPTLHPQRDHGLPDTLILDFWPSEL